MLPGAGACRLHLRQLRREQRIARQPLAVRTETIMPLRRTET